MNKRQRKKLFKKRNEQNCIVVKIKDNKRKKKDNIKVKARILCIGNINKNGRVYNQKTMSKFNKEIGKIQYTLPKELFNKDENDEDWSIRSV